MHHDVYVAVNKGVRNCRLRDEIAISACGSEIQVGVVSWHRRDLVRFVQLYRTLIVELWSSLVCTRFKFDSKENGLFLSLHFVHGR